MAHERPGYGSHGGYHWHWCTAALALALSGCGLLSRTTVTKDSHQEAARVAVAEVAAVEVKATAEAGTAVCYHEGGEVAGCPNCDPADNGGGK